MTEDHLADLAAAMAEVDRLTRQCIVDELAGLMGPLDQAEETAAGILRAAVEALEEPERAIAGLDAEIAQAEAELATWREQLEDGDVAGRVTARQWISEWEAERDALAQRRDFAQAGLLPLFDARNKARADLELAQGAKRGLAFAMVLPFETAVGQATQAYVGLRQPYLHRVLMSGDRDHPEYELGVVQLREWCLATGFRTDDLPSIAEIQAAAETASMADAAASVTDAGPNMVDVLKQTEVDVANMALQRQPARIEDHRNTPPPPRQVTERPWMKLPRAR